MLLLPRHRCLRRRLYGESLSDLQNAVVAQGGTIAEASDSPVGPVVRATIPARLAALGTIFSRELDRALSDDGDLQRPGAQGDER